MHDLRIFLFDDSPNPQTTNDILLNKSSEVIWQPHTIKEYTHFFH